MADVPVAGRSRGAGAFGVATVIAQACALARYVVLAQLLGPVQLGLAAILVVTANFFEQITETGSDRYLVQNRDAGSEEALALAHYVAVTRGVLIAAALALAAWPLARFFGQSALAWAFVGLAAYPAIFGLRHLDYRRQQRDRDFRAESRIVLWSEIAGLVGTVAGALLLRDFTAILIGLTLRAAVHALISHLGARCRYRLALSPEHLKPMMRFALPLIPNGALLFIATQGDRVLIGRLAGMAELGVYSAILLLLYYPLAMIQRWIAQTSLPLLSQVQADDAELARRARELGLTVAFFGIASMAGYALLGPMVSAALFGPQFAADRWLFAAIAVFQLLRFARVWPTTIALADGRTGYLLLPNLARLIAIPAALALYGWEPLLLSIVAAFALGEFAGLAVALLLVAGMPNLGGSGSEGVRAKLVAPLPSILMLAGTVAMLLAVAGMETGAHWQIALGAGALAGTVWMASSGLRGAFASAWRRRRVGHSVS